MKKNHHVLGGKRAPMITVAAVVYIGLMAFFAAMPAFAQSSPIAEIPIGDGPYAMELTADGKSAVISLLFPEEDGDPNLVVIDIENETVTDQLRFGRRLFRVGVVDSTLLKNAGGASPVVLVNADADRVTMADIQSGNVLAEIPSGRNPSNVEIVQGKAGAEGVNAQNFAIVTNGTGGDVSFIDLDSRQMIGQVNVGDDPRAVAVTPDGRYMLTVLRADNTLSIVDLQAVTTASVQAAGMRSAPKAAASSAEIARIAVGQDPTAVKISPDGTTAIVANLTNNAISVLNISDPANPRVVRNPKTNGVQIPVGQQPTSIAITPDNSQAFIANAGSAWVTVVDLVNPGVKGILRIQRSGAAIATSASAVRVTPDGGKLLVSESGNQANLLIYEIDNLSLEPLPAVEVPDEPASNIVLERTADEACGYYTAVLSLQEGASDGFWSMEILATAGTRVLEGGLNLGGAFDADARNPGFGAIRIANKNNENQIVDIKINSAALPTEGFADENLGISVQIFNGTGNREPVTEEVIGTDQIEFSAELSPGFYIVRIKSQPGSPRGTFEMGFLTRFVDRAGGGFQGGANVGGLLTRLPNGSSTKAFAGFCLSETQKVLIRTEAGTTRGPIGAGNLELTIKNRQREIVQHVSNSVPPPPPVEPPAPPSLEGITPNIYVDANAGPNGTGTSSKPFKSITKAVGQAATTGKVILVRPGTYSPSLTGEVLPIGSPGPGLNRIPKGVQLIGSGAANTIIDAESSLRDGKPVNALGVGSDEVRIAGFTVRDSSGVGIFVLNADNVQIDSNFFIGNGRFAVGASGTGGFVLKGNVARANSESGFSVSDAPKIPVSNPPAGCPSAFGACVIDNIANEHSRDGILLSSGGDYYVVSNTAMNNGISGIEANNQSNNGPLNTIIKDNLTANNGGVLFPFSGTGILVTEFSHADEISGNLAINNRPGGIAVFEDSSATLIDSNIVRNSKQNGLVVQKRASVDTISNNEVLNSGLSGIFVENNASVDIIRGNEVNGNGTCTECTSAKAGLAILGNSTVGLVENSAFNNNALGMQIANSSLAEKVTGSSFDGNLLRGLLLTGGSAIPDFTGNTSENNGGPASIAFEDSVGLIRETEVSATEGAGISVAVNSDVIVENSTVSNAALEGVRAERGSQLMLNTVKVTDNGDTGVFAAGSSTAITLENSTVTGNHGYGVDAQNDATIVCQGVNTISGNDRGQIQGSVQNCN